MGFLEMKKTKMGFQCRFISRLFYLLISFDSILTSVVFIVVRSFVFSVFIEIMGVESVGVVFSVLCFLIRWFESRRIWAAGLVVSELCQVPSHWSRVMTLNDWMVKEGIPGISGIDTRCLTQMIREKGTMLGKIIIGDEITGQMDDDWEDPNHRNLVKEVSTEVA